MSIEKSILIGCDDNAVLLHIQMCVEKIKSYDLNVISITKESSLLSVSKSVEPAMIIICFCNNYKLLRELTSLSNVKRIPLLCFNKYIDSKALAECSNGIIFSYEFNHILKYGYVNSAITSVISLMESKPQDFNNQEVFYDDISLVKHQSISRYILELDQKKEILLKVKNRIKLLYSNVKIDVRMELHSIVNTINSVTSDKTIWEYFKLYFDEINPGFLLKLSQKHPELTIVDLKYCCYFKMNMSNNDICKLLGINQESVRTHKYRLKKKMVIPKDENLHNYVLNMMK